MLSSAEEFLGKAHLEQIVECEAVFSSDRIERADQIGLDPLTNPLRRDGENSRSRARGKSFAPSGRLYHLQAQPREYKDLRQCSQSARVRFLNTCGADRLAADFLECPRLPNDHLDSLLRFIDSPNRLIVRHPPPCDRAAARLSHFYP